MKDYGWHWNDSKQKRAAHIMWETQGQDFDHVISLIMERCNLSNLNARQLYRKMARILEPDGFVPAPIKKGRPRKTDVPSPYTRTQPEQESVRLVSNTDTEAQQEPEPEQEAQQEPEPERTATGERKSISDMKSYLEQLKRKAG